MEKQKQPDAGNNCTHCTGIVTVGMPRVTQLLYRRKKMSLFFLSSTVTRRSGPRKPEPDFRKLYVNRQTEKIERLY